jgi:Fe2+ transport system protein FeoA
MQCPLCGYEFDETALSCHASCAFNKACAIICCPNCGYQVADEGKSRLAAALRRALRQRRIPNAAELPVRPLSAMQPGQSGTVVAIDSDHHARVERLHVLGLVENAQVTLEQTRPTIVLRVGFTELSVEREVADEIVVEVDTEAARD